MAGTNSPTPTPRKNLASGNWFCRRSMTRLQLWIMTPNSRWGTKHLHTYFHALSRCHRATTVWGIVTVMYEGESLPCVPNEEKTWHVAINNMPYSQHEVGGIVCTICTLKGRCTQRAFYIRPRLWQVSLRTLCKAHGLSRWLVFSSSK